MEGRGYTGEGDKAFFVGRVARRHVEKVQRKIKGERKKGLEDGVACSGTERDERKKRALVLGEIYRASARDF